MVWQILRCTSLAAGPCCLLQPQAVPAAPADRDSGLTAPVIWHPCMNPSRPDLTVHTETQPCSAMDCKQWQAACSLSTCLRYNIQYLGPGKGAKLVRQAAALHLPGTRAICSPNMLGKEALSPQQSAGGWHEAPAARLAAARPPPAPSSPGAVRRTSLSPAHSSLQLHRQQRLGGGRVTDDS